MKARALIYNDKLITVWNGELEIHPQLEKFVEDNKNTILDEIDYHEGGYIMSDQDLPFFEYGITIGGDNGIMVFQTIIYEI